MPGFGSPNTSSPLRSIGQEVLGPTQIQEAISALSLSLFKNSFIYLGVSGLSCSTWDLCCVIRDLSVEKRGLLSSCDAWIPEPAGSVVTGQAQLPRRMYLSSPTRD